MVRLWDTSTGRELMLLEGHREGVLAVSFSPDDRRLATGANDDEVRVWDLATGKSQLLGTHDGDVFGIGFDPSGTRLASASGDRTARVWELASGRHLELRGHRADVNRVVFSPDGKRVATLGDDALRLWDAETGAPAWRTVLLRETVPEIYTQRGWTTLAGQPLAGAGESWRQAVASAVLASEREGRVCVATRSGTVEIWTPSIDRLRVEEQVGEVEALVATSDGCVALSGGRAVFVGATSKELTTGATALASDGDEILVGVPNAVRRFGPEGRSRGEVPLLHTPTSLTQGFAGTSAGTLQRFEGFAPSLEDAPASAVTAVAEGPPGIVVLGFSQGLVGLWDLTTGGRLEAWQLHGPVTNIVLVGHELRMASELGDWRVANLDAFYLDHCEVLRRLWRRTPVAVDEGRIVLRAPPVDHACAKRVD
jgi:hypothetical protein